MGSEQGHLACDPGAARVGVVAHQGTSQPGSRPVSTSASRSRPTTVAAQSSLRASRRAVATAGSGGGVGCGDSGRGVRGRSWGRGPFAEGPVRTGRGGGRERRGHPAARHSGRHGAGRPVGSATELVVGVGAARGPELLEVEPRCTDGDRAVTERGRLHASIVSGAAPGSNGAPPLRALSGQPSGWNHRGGGAAHDRQAAAVSPRTRSTRRSIGRNTSSSMPMPDEQDQEDRGDHRGHVVEVAALLEVRAEPEAQLRARPR